MHPIRLSGNGQLVSDKVSKLKKNKSSSSNLTSWQLWESLWQAAFYAIGRFAVCVPAELSSLSEGGGRTSGRGGGEFEGSKCWGEGRGKINERLRERRKNGLEMGREMIFNMTSRKTKK